jgi:hypothetical protein
VVPHLGTITVPSHPTLYRLNMWCSWVRRKGTTQGMYIAKLKDGLKRVTKTFSMICKRFSKWYDGGGKMKSYKKGFKVKVFSSSQNIGMPFYLKRFLKLFSLFFFNTFSSSFSLFFSMLCLLRTWRVLIILEKKNHFIKNFFSNEMVWTG